MAAADAEPETGVGPTATRWPVLFAFSFLSGLNNFMWIEFAPVRSATASYYGVSGDDVDWLSMIYMAIYPVVFLPCSFFIEKDARSLQRGLRISAAMNCAGAAMRWGSCASHSFALVFLGQTVCAVAQGFSLGAPPRIAALWFPEAEWGLATGIGVFANQLGPAVAYYLVPDVVTGTNGDGMNVLLEGTLFCTIAALALVVVAIPEAPARAPSALAAKRDETAAPTFKAFCRNCADLYLSPVTGAGVSLLSLGYGAAVGVLYALSTDLEVLLPDLSTHGVSVVGGAFISAGLPGALGGGAILDLMVVKRFRGLNVAMAAAGAVVMAGIAIDSGTSAITDICILVSILGFLLSTITSAGFEWGVELSYPASESTVAGALNVAAQTGGIALIYGVEGLSSERVLANGVLCLALVFAALVFIAVGSEQRRQAARGPVGEAARLTEPAVAEATIL